MLEIEVFTSPGCSKCAHARQVLERLVDEPGDERGHWCEMNIPDDLRLLLNLCGCAESLADCPILDSLENTHDP